jgi:hypothetical protein
VLLHHPHRPLSYLRGVHRRLLHGSILSSEGASGKAGAVHFGDLEAAGATIITGLEDAVRKSAQKLAEQL